MSGEVQATCPLKAGFTIVASRIELKVGTTMPSPHHIPFTSDMVAAVCRAMAEKGEGGILYD